MAGEQEVDAGIGDGIEGTLRAADDLAIRRQGRRHQGMVGDEGAEGTARDAVELIADIVHLMLRDAPVAQRRRARGIDAENGKLGIGEEWKLVRRDVAME